MSVDQIQLSCAYGCGVLVTFNKPDHRTSEQFCQAWKDDANGRRTCDAPGRDTTLRLPHPRRLGHTGPQIEALGKASRRRPAVMRRAAFCALALVLGAPFVASAAAAEAVTLVAPVVYGTHVPGLGTPARDLAKALEQQSGGSLRLDLKEPGEGTAPHEILDKV